MWQGELQDVLCRQCGGVIETLTVPVGTQIPRNQMCDDCKRRNEENLLKVEMDCNEYL